VQLFLSCFVFLLLMLPFDLDDYFTLGLRHYKTIET
jgi:hypothetical protein